MTQGFRTSQFGSLGNKSDLHPRFSLQKWCLEDDPFLSELPDFEGLYPYHPCMPYLPTFGCFQWYDMVTLGKYTPPKINIEPENDGLEDDFPFWGVYSQVPAVNLPGCTLHGCDMGYVAKATGAGPAKPSNFPFALRQLWDVSPAGGKWRPKIHGFHMVSLWKFRLRLYNPILELRGPPCIQFIFITVMATQVTLSTYSHKLQLAFKIGTRGHQSSSLRPWNSWNALWTASKRPHGLLTTWLMTMTSVPK